MRDEKARKVLGTLITWMGQHSNAPIGYLEAKQLLEMLNEPESENVESVTVSGAAGADDITITIGNGKDMEIRVTGIELKMGDTLVLRPKVVFQ